MQLAGIEVPLWEQWIQSSSASSIKSASKIKRWFSVAKKSVLLPELSSSLQKLTTASNALQCLEEKKSMFQSKPTGSPSLMHLVQWFCFCKRSKSQMARAGCHYQSLLNEDPLCSSARSWIAKQWLLLQLPTPFCLPSNGLIWDWKISQCTLSSTTLLFNLNVSMHSTASSFLN